MSDVTDILTTLACEKNLVAVRMNASNYHQLIAKANFSQFEIFTELHILRTGLYGKWCGLEIHVNRSVKSDYLQLQLADSPETWSPDIDLNLFHLVKPGNLNRLLQLKAFW